MIYFFNNEFFRKRIVLYDKILGFNSRGTTIIINNIFIFLFVYKKIERTVIVQIYPTRIGFVIRYQR